jgi:hypothetical protein
VRCVELPNVLNRKAQLLISVVSQMQQTKSYTDKGLTTASSKQDGGSSGGK